MKNKMLASWVIGCSVLLGCSSSRQATQILGRGFKPVEIDATDSSLFVKNEFLLDGPQLVFGYADSLGFASKVFFEKKKNEFYLNAPTWLTQIDGVNIPYLVFPNDNLKLKIEKDGSLVMVSKKAERNNELNFLKELINTVGEMNFDYEEMHFKGGAPDFQSMDSIYSLYRSVAALKQRRQEFLDTYASQKQVSPAFYTITQNLISNYALKDTLAILERHKQLFIRNDQFEKTLTGLLARMNTNYESTMNSSLANARRILKLLLPSYRDLYINDEQTFNNQFETINRYFTGKARNILLTQAVIDAYRARIPVTEDNLRTYTATTNNRQYQQAVMTLRDDTRALGSLTGNDADKVISLKSKLAYTSIEELVSKNDHKLVLLDIWASWCKPCRNEIPVSRQLAHEYKNKDISFVYISFEKAIADWKKASLAQDLPFNASWIVPNGTQSNFYQKYNLATIPRYMLFDRSGKLLLADAPRPSDPHLKELLDKYLE